MRLATFLSAAAASHFRSADICTNLLLPVSTAVSDAVVREKSGLP
jgi:hypothetical protein